MKKHFLLTSLASLILGIVLASLPGKEGLAQSPAGSYSLAVNGEAHPIFDLSGNLSHSIDGFRLSRTLSVDQGGKFSGTVVVVSNNPEVPLPVSLSGPLSGKIKGINENLAVVFKAKILQSADFGSGNEIIKLRYVEKLALDTLGNAVAGTLKLKFRSPSLGRYTGRYTIDDTLDNYFATPDTGWRLTLNLAVGEGMRLAASGSIIPNETGRSFGLDFTGKYYETTRESCWGTYDPRLYAGIAQIYAYLSYRRTCRDRTVYIFTAKGKNTAQPRKLKLKLINAMIDGDDLVISRLKYKALGQKGLIQPQSDE